MAELEQDQNIKALQEMELDRRSLPDVETHKMSRPLLSFERAEIMVKVLHNQQIREIATRSFEALQMNGGMIYQFLKDNTEITKDEWKIFANGGKIQKHKFEHLMEILGYDNSDITKALSMGESKDFFSVKNHSHKPVQITEVNHAFKVLSKEMWTPSSLPTKRKGMSFREMASKIACNDKSSYDEQSIYRAITKSDTTHVGSERRKFIFDNLLKLAEEGYCIYSSNAEKGGKNLREFILENFAPDNPGWGKKYQSQGLGR